MMKDGTIYNKRTIKFAIAAICAFAVLVGTVVCVNYNKKPVDVSLAELVINPEKFHGKYIRTEGLWNFEYEGTNLYLNYEARGTTSPCVWLESHGVSDDEFDKMTRLHGRYAVVEGVFNAKNTGHCGESNGAIEKISYYEAID